MSNGILYVVATPIGNVGDLSPRAREVLSSVSLIAAEDTRHSGKLLQIIGCNTPMLSLHEHNEQHRSVELLSRLQNGVNIALISDAGTPLISDPGYGLVRELVAHGIRVVPIPGACAAIAALSVSGLSTARFVFEGFPGAKPNKRRERLRELAHESRTLVFYEAPHRLQETLADMLDAFGSQRRVALCREITKLHETCYYETMGELVQRATTDADLSRGEIVIVVEGAPEVESTAIPLAAEQVLFTLLEELPAAQAAKLAAKLTGAPRSELYERAVKHKSAKQ